MVCGLNLRMRQFGIRSQLKNLFFVLLSILCLSACSPQGGEVKQKPNVLIILTDDLGYGDISCYGQKGYETPNIDYLAENGVSCSDFYVPTTYCAPSRETLLTGRFPLRHGLIKKPTPDAGINDIGIESREITLGEVFQEAGYKPKCIGKWHTITGSRQNELKRLNLIMPTRPCLVILV